MRAFTPLKISRICPTMTHTGLIRELNVIIMYYTHLKLHKTMQNTENVMPKLHDRTRVYEPLSWRIRELFTLNTQNTAIENSSHDH